MKYGLIVFFGSHGNAASRNAKMRFNLGDNIQMIAMNRILTEVLHVPEEQIVKIDFHDLATYDGEPVVLPINLFFFGCGNSSKTWFPASPKIIPVFTGVHFASRILTPEQVQYLVKFSPIGCRDYHTLETMRSYQIPAYLGGCVTATLPKRNNPAVNGKTFFIDVPKGEYKGKTFMDCVPEQYLKNAEFVSHEFEAYPSDDLFDINHDRAKNLLERYRKEASLVVTSKLHCAVPCAAMGIPVILAMDEVSSRFAWVESLIPIYLPKDYAQIDWNTCPPDYEELKLRMVSLISNRLKAAYDTSSDAYDMSGEMKAIGAFFEQNIRSNYSEPLDALFSTLDAVQFRQFRRYILWGCTCNADDIYEYIQHSFPEMRLEAIVDEFSDSEFKTMTTIRSNALCSYTGVPIIVTTMTAYSYIQERLDQLDGCGPFIFVDGSIITHELPSVK